MQLEQDLHYIKQAVERNRADRLRSWSIWSMWAIITFVGFAIIDVAPSQTGRYWLVAGPLGGVLTWLRSRALSSDHGVRLGEGLCAIAHWLGMAAGQILILSLCDMPGQQQATAAILVVALAYFYMGLYRARPFLWFSALLAIGAMAIRYAQFPYVWTSLGAALAAAFLLTAAVAHRSPVHETAP